MVEASFPNPEFLLRPGLYAKVRIMFSFAKDSFVIPQRCVMETQGKFSVMVLTDSNTVKAVTIKVGEATDGKWQITDGLNPGDKLVYEGLQKVRTGSAVAPELVPFTLEQKQEPLCQKIKETFLFIAPLWQW